MQFIENVCTMFVYVTNIYGNFKYVYVQHLKPCTLKKSFKTNCICNHLYQVNAYHVVCLSLYPVCLPRQPGWQWPGAPQRVGAHGGEDLGGGRRQRGEHKVPAALHLPLRLPRRGGRRGAPGRWHHTSTHLPPNPAPSSPALRRRPAGRVNASHKTAASSAHSGSSWTAKTTQPGEGREQGKGPAPTFLSPMLLLLK